MFAHFTTELLLLLCWEDGGFALPGKTTTLPLSLSLLHIDLELVFIDTASSSFKRAIPAETLGDPYIRGLPLPRIPVSRELKPDDGQTVSVQPIAEWTPRARLTRLLNGHTKIIRGLE